MHPIEKKQMLRTRILLVTCGIIWKGREVLIARRKPDSRLEPLKWEFPGGKIEFSENPPSALRREIKEELNFEIEVGDIYGVSSHTYLTGTRESRHVLMLAYSCAYKKGEPEKRDVHDFRWVRIENLESYDFAAADYPLIDRLRKDYARPPDRPGEETDPENLLSDDDCPVAVLKNEVKRFVAERDWEQFHSPKNLSMSIAIEAAELMEHFQWNTTSEARLLSRDPDKYEEIIREVADIAIYILSLCGSLNINLSEAITRKLQLNREKYPLEKYWGKYTD